MSAVTAIAPSYGVILRLLRALLQFVLDEREAAAAAGGAGRRMGPGQETAALECGGVRGRVGWGWPDWTSQRCFEGLDVLICKYVVVF